MLRYLHLKNVGPAPEMEAELGQRINLITGDNGLGKSFLLDIAWWALTRTWPAKVNSRLVSGLMARPRGPGKASVEFRFDGAAKTKNYVSEFDRARQNWASAGRPANPGLVLYAQVDGSFALWDPARNLYGRARDSDHDSPERQPAYVFTPREVWEGLQAADGTMLCNGLFADWATWQNKGNDAFARLTEILAMLSPQDGELRPGELTRLGTDTREIPTIRMPYGLDVPVVHASAGLRRILALAYFLVWSWQEHTHASNQLEWPTARQVIFLIDEIEAHLHPRWQRQIVRPLLHIVESLSPDAYVQLIAATHSPLVPASMEPLFDPEQDAWFDLDLDTSSSPPQVQLRHRRFLRRGDASSWLTSEAFDLKEARSLEAEKAILEALALLRGEVPHIEIPRIDAALRATMPGMDPFWIRWSAFVEKAGSAP